MTDREVMKMAFDAFEDLKKSVTRDGTVSENWDAYYEKEYYALEALRQALAQPEPAPVAWVDTVWVERHDVAKQLQMQQMFSRCQLNNNQIPLYTAPPKSEWVGLTDEERRHFNNRLSGSGVAEEIDALLKEKNGD